jgi:hypothetical protein
VLRDAGGSLPGNHAVLDPKVEAILSNFGFRKLGAEGGVELSVAYRRAPFDTHRSGFR